MKLHLPKQLFTALLTAFTLAAAPSAWGDDMTFTGVNNRSIDTSSTTAEDTVIFQMTDTTDKNVSQNFFAGNDTRTTHANIVISDNEETDGMEGLVITDGNSSNKQIYTGTVTGNGIIRKQGPSSANAITFEGNVTEFTGDIHIATASDFTLTFGGHTNAVAASATSAEAGVAGTGDIRIDSSGTALNFNYTASSNPVYITNDISESGDYSSIINLKGGANYIFTKTAAVDKFSIDTNTSVKLTQGSYTFGSAGAVSGGGLLILGDGVTAEITATKGIQTHVEVNGGGTLKSSVVDGTWYESASATKSITLAGTSSEKMATFDVTARQTYVTPTYMNGNAQITSSNAGGSLQLFTGATFTVTGTNNIISAAMTTSRASLFNVAEGGTLEIRGQVTRNGSNVENDTITKTGAGELIFSHSNNTIQGGLIIENGKVTIAEGGKINIHNTISNAGTLNIEGTLNISNVSAFEGAGEMTGYSSSSSAVNSNDNGYAVYNKILIANGTVILGSNASVTGITSAEVENGVGLVGSLETDVSLTATFYVNKGTVKLGDGAYTDYEAASTFVVKSGATLDINGKILANETAELEGGATLTNTGAAAEAKSTQLQSLTLHGNATIAAVAGKQYGLSGAGQQETNLLLNGHTLTKTGEGAFLLINTTVNAGTIDIQAGSIQVGCDSGRKLTDASQTVISLSGGDISVNGGDTFKVAGLTGTSASSKLSGWGNLEFTGSGNYETAAAVTGNMKLTVNMAQGASQTLHADSGWKKETAGGKTQMLMLNQGTLNLHLDEGASLNQSSIGRTNGTLVLSGSGVYDLGTSARPGYVSGLNQDTWKGNVVIGNGTSTFDWNGLNFSNLGNANSKVTLQGVFAHLNDSGHIATNVNTLKDSAYGVSTGVNPHQYTTNIELKNATVGGVEKVAFELDDGYSDSIYEFCGKISGSGSMKWSKNDVTDQMWIFSGDVKDWTGQFYATGNKEQIIRFTDGATNIGTSVGVTTGHLSVQISNNADVEVNGVFSDKLATLDGTGTGAGTLNLKIDNVNHTTSFNQNVDVDKLDITEGSTVNFNSQVTVSNTVTNNGTLKLAQLVTNGETEETQERASISGKQDSAATMSKVQMSSTGISGTAADGTKGSISDADVQIAQLAQDASFTIADMTLTNTSITAASVNMTNVTAVGNVVFNTTRPASLTAPMVGQGGSDASTKGELEYSFGLGVAEGSTLTLNLDVLNAVAGDQHGVYDLTITLSGFGADFAVTEAVLGMVKFDENSWLGQALEGAMFSVVTESATEAAAAAAGGAPSVSYAAGSNVGTLVITINGLNVPEPTTATLSLLALAALAARRRRK